MGMRFCHTRRTCVVVFILAVSLLTSPGSAITSKITRQSSSKELLQGKTDNVVVTSRGTIQLGRAAKVLAPEIKDAWAINSLVVSGGTVYLGTSPNGIIYKYNMGKLTRLYPPEGQPLPEKAPSAKEPNEPAVAEGKDSGKAKGEIVKAEERFANQHIYAMAMDVAGRLLVGISGSKARLCRYESGALEKVFEPNDARYIFAIEVDNIGNIYLGTGPEGKVYSLDPSGKVAQLIYDSPDKNILSLAAGQDGLIYAGSDTRGLIYKINPRNKTATVVYDSEEPEISSLLFTGAGSPDGGTLYAAATSAKVAQAESQFAAQQDTAGRPEPKEESTKALDSDGSIRLKIANTTQEATSKTSPRSRPAPKTPKPGAASYVYQINKQGYVTEIFTEAAVFLCAARQDDKLLIGSGNEGQLFAVEPGSEREAVIYKDEAAGQIPAVAVAGKDVYVGTANPAKLVLLSPDYAAHGTYVSDLIDAGQPARWGKLQIDADIPRGCKVLVVSRSGNVKDINDPTFSEWTEASEVTEPVQLRCPLGRFCQYKLTLETQDGQKTPLVREIAVASTVPNLAPQVESVDISRLTNPEKRGLFKISYKATDQNEDKLVYKIDFRRIGRSHWVELEDRTEEETYEWDGKTVEDGRYEIRVTASDERSNTPTTKLTGSRISDPIVVDNSGPVIRKYSIDKNGKAATLKLQVADELSVISKLEYTIDSNAEWKGTLPDDGVFDTTDESFTIVTDDLEPGEHVIAVKIGDDVGNVTYKTFELSVLGK